MEPGASSSAWVASSSAGIDEETLRELLEMDIFSSKPLVFSEPLGDGFIDAYKEELQARTENPLAGPEQLDFWEDRSWLDFYPIMSDATVLTQRLGSGRVLTPLREGPQQPGDLNALTTLQLGDEQEAADGRKKRNRTPMQQALNKRAQQRYRERRKEKQVNLEAEVASLKQQLDALHQLEPRNTELVQRNKFLEMLVKMQQEEVYSLKSQLLLPVRSAATASSDVHSRMSTPDEIHKDLETHVRALMQFLSANKINQADQPVASSSKHLIGKIVEAVCEATVKLTVAHNSKAEELMDKDLRLANKTHQLDSLKPCIDKMKLKDDQVTAILHMRTDHLTRMFSVYRKRQELNQKAMSLMLPHPLHEKGGRLDPTADGKIDCMGKAGYRDCSTGDELLTAVLDEIGKNIQKEQRSYFELQVAMLQSILSPVQASMFIVHCHPELVDALAFANTLAVLNNDKSMDHHIALEDAA